MQQTSNYSIFRSYIQRVRVPLGFALAIVYLYLAHPTLLLFIWGILVAFVGMLIRAWASGYIRKNEVLTTNGPYALTRNPLYFGSLLMGLGCTIAGGNFIFVAISLLFFLFVYLPVMYAEAEHLKLLFPSEYLQYESKVPLFIPRLFAFRRELQVKFSPQLYLAHREYRALFGLIGVFAVLLIKLIFQR